MTDCAKNLAAFEEKGMWSTAIAYLNSLWEQDRVNLEYALRLITECWFVLSNHACLTTNEEVDSRNIKELLMHVLAVCDASSLINNPVYLCVTGYIMQINPESFNKANVSYDTIVRDSWSRLNTAYQKSSADIRINMLYNGFIATYDEYKLLQSKHMKEMEILDWDRTAVSEYFHDVLCKSF